MPLTLSCAGSAIFQSAYFVVWLSRTNVSSGDLPPEFKTTLSGITTLDINIGNWNATETLPSPANGTWNSSTTYGTGDTVASAQYSIRSSDGSVNIPLVYRSLVSGNTNNKPELFNGKWTCITKPPQGSVVNKDFSTIPFAYALSPLPTRTTIAATSWVAQLWNSVSWTVTRPGDVVQLVDIYIILNYLVGSSIIRILSRPLSHSETTGTQGAILNPGINTQFQCWHTSGLSDPPILTLNNFDPTAFIDGAQPNAIVGTNYLSALTAGGGTPPYAFAIISGSLPPGVSLDGTTGVISGTPSSSGIFDFTAQVTDNTGATATVTCAAPIECATASSANLTLSVSDAILFAETLDTSVPGEVISALERSDSLALSDSASFRITVILGGVPTRPNAFEFYEMLPPENVEVLPVPKKYDQLGPMRFDKIAKCFGFRVRMIVNGTTSSVPFQVYGDDSPTAAPGYSGILHSGSFPVLPGTDYVYEVQFPKSVNSCIIRLVLGPINDTFHRYDVTMKIQSSGMQGQSKWIPIR